MKKTMLNICSAKNQKALQFVFDFLYAHECPVSGCSNRAYVLPQNTSYYDDWRNLAYYCKDHHKENDEYWEERWSEYYSMCY